ncbi:hypothetical protein E8E11_006271 [Didymella keratinophila]|nr:hypothetical protein E8E11_006271 [Didymella keratinophila]
MAFRIKLITSNMEAINLRNQQESPLLRLPPEIRVNIYTHVFSSHQIIFSLHKLGMTRYERDDDASDSDDDQNNDDEENHEDEEPLARKKRVNATALRRTCSLIRQEIDQIYHTTSTIKLWEINQSALLEVYLELPIVQHATIFWFKISMEDVDRMLNTPHLSDILT